MKNALLIAVLTAMGTGIVMSGAGFADRVAQMNRGELMEQKLTDAQRLLEGLAQEDFELIGQSAKQLAQLSIEAQWTDAYSPLYGKFGTEFRNATGRIEASADERNIDGAALNYVQLVMVCVHCHKAMRGVEDIAFDPGMVLEPVGD